MLRKTFGKTGLAIVAAAGLGFAVGCDEGYESGAELGETETPTLGYPENEVTEGNAGTVDTPRQVGEAETDLDLDAGAEPGVGAQDRFETPGSYGTTTGGENTGTLGTPGATDPVDQQPGVTGQPMQQPGQQAQPGMDQGGTQGQPLPPTQPGQQQQPTTPPQQGQAPAQDDAAGGGM